MDTKLFVRKQSGGMFAVIDKGLTTGDIWWVHSGTGSDSAGYGRNPEAPFASIDYAVGQCTANNGDRIYVLPGHVETVSAAGGLDLDVAGITIIFLGEGQSRGRITFGTVVGADMDVDAADITLINPRFTAGLDALTGPIDVNAARFKIIDGTYEDGTTIDTTDCIVADANADDLVIDGWTYYAGDEGGTQKQSAIQIAGANRPILRRINVTGDFGTAVIENGTAWVDALLEDCKIENTNAGPVVGILLQATSSGAARRVDVRVASGVTYVTANNDMQWFACRGVGTDAGAGATIGNLEDTANNLIGVNDADNAADTSSVAANEDGSVLERLEQIQEAVNKGTGTAVPANTSLYDLLRLRSNTGEVDIDIDQADYTSLQTLLTITPAAGAPLQDVVVVLDCAKAATGFVAGHAAQTIQFVVERKVDGSNWRGDTATTAVAANAMGDETAKLLNIGPVGVTEEVRIGVVLSAENAVDVEFPYVAYYRAVADPTFTEVAAA